MKQDCLELLAKLDKCMEDPDFQLLIIMKFIRSLSPYLQPVVKGDDDERNNKRVIM